MQMKEKELSIIIVNYNGDNYLEDCINSIYTCCKSIDFEIIIIDNNSKDGSVALLKREFPEIELIESAVNLGFAGGNNSAVKKASGKNILLLNNDTILLNDLSVALDELNKDEVGVVSIKMLDKNKQYKKSVGKFPTIFSLMLFSKLYIKRQGFETGNFSNERYEVDWVEGSFLLTRRDYYIKLGGLTEDYFMYVEDVDYCKKIALLEKKRIYFPSISYVHYSGFNSTRNHRLIDGYKIYVNKYFTSLKPIALLILSLKKELLKILR
jgi:GT2 family glycosyltransferase